MCVLGWRKGRQILFCGESDTPKGLWAVFEEGCISYQIAVNDGKR